MIHELKTWPDPFQAVWSGKKTAELRKDDRGFKVGDTLRLREYVPTDSEYTGWVIDAEVTHILRGPLFGLSEGMVMMSIAVESRYARYEHPAATASEQKPKAGSVHYILSRLDSNGIDDEFQEGG